MRNTIIWVALGALSQFAVGLVTALALNRKVRGRGFARSAVFAPYGLCGVGVGRGGGVIIERAGARPRRMSGWI